MTWLVIILAAWGLVIIGACWAGNRMHAAAAPDEPVPYWPAGTSPCTWCKPAPSGLCSCTAPCGHKRCVHVAGRGWTARDRKILEGKKLP